MPLDSERDSKVYRYITKQAQSSAKGSTYDADIEGALSRSNPSSRPSSAMSTSSNRTSRSAPDALECVQVCCHSGRC